MVDAVGSGSATGKQAFVSVTDSDGGKSRAMAVVQVGTDGNVSLGVPTSVSRIVSAAASTNATVAKNAAGKLFGATGYNANAALRYLKVYNKTTAPTVGTDTPILTLALPPTAAFSFTFAGLSFATGISYALTTGVADNDTGALTAADVLALNVVYS